MPGEALSLPDTQLDRTCAVWASAARIGTSSLWGRKNGRGTQKAPENCLSPHPPNSNLCCQSLPLDLLLKRGETPDPPKDPLKLNTWLQLVTRSEPVSLPSMEQQSSAAATQPHKFCSCFSDTSSPSHSDVTKLVQTGWPRQEEFKLRLGRKPIPILVKDLSVTKMPFFIY